MMLMNNSGSTTCLSTSRTASSVMGIGAPRVGGSVGFSPRGFKEHYTAWAEAHATLEAARFYIIHIHADENVVSFDFHVMGDGRLRGRHREDSTIANVELRTVPR